MTNNLKGTYFNSKSFKNTKFVDLCSAVVKPTIVNKKVPGSIHEHNIPWKSRKT